MPRHTATWIHGSIMPDHFRVLRRLPHLPGRSMFLYNFGDDVMKRVTDEGFPQRLRRDVVIGLLRLYTNELLYYMDEPENPHGPFDLNEAVIQRLPINGTLQDVKGCTVSRGDAADIQDEEDGLMSHVTVAADAAGGDFVVLEEDVLAWLAGGYRIIVANESADDAVCDVAVDVLIAVAATAAAARSYLRCFLQLRGDAADAEPVPRPLGDLVDTVCEYLAAAEKADAATAAAAIEGAQPQAKEKARVTMKAAKEAAAVAELALDRAAAQHAGCPPYVETWANSFPSSGPPRNAAKTSSETAQAPRGR